MIYFKVVLYDSGIEAISFSNIFPSSISTVLKARGLIKI